MRVFAPQTSDMSGGERQEVPNRHLAVSASTMSNQGASIQRKSSCLCAGGCHQCQSQSRIQPKLKVGAPNDKYEQEADRVAEQIVSSGTYSSSGHDPAHNRIQRMCDNCEEEEQAEENSVQRKSDSARDTKMPSRTESYIDSLSGGGAPLSRSEAQYYEPRFGHSFSKIRVHTGEAADRAANSINARAFTLGNNIAFARGEYDFSSTSGRKLMAHELAHTLQQSNDGDSVQRGSPGLSGGKCCNRAHRVEWALVGAGVWEKLESGECSGLIEDCDGMTCGGGFYHVDNLQRGTCSTPRNDDATFAPRRWTPTSAAGSATSPTAEGSTQTDTPPNYVYDAAATAACPNGIHTITVDSIRLHGATTSPAAQIATANAAYSGCCVRIVAGATPPQETEATTKSWLGGDTDLNWDENCGSVTAEETAMFDGATTAHHLNSRMRVFYVGTMTPTTALANSLPPYCATGASAPYLDYIEINNGALSDTLAHELGHILLDSGRHSGIVNPADTQNLMFAPGRTASNLDATQCSTIFGNS